MDFAQFKAQTLSFCLQFAKVDPTYALWMAGEYERQMPWLLTNLKRKVQQEISRASAQEEGSGKSESGPA